MAETTPGSQNIGISPRDLEAGRVAFLARLQSKLTDEVPDFRYCLYLH